MSSVPEKAPVTRTSPIKTDMISRPEDKSFWGYTLIPIKSIPIENQRTSPSPTPTKNDYNEKPKITPVGTAKYIEKPIDQKPASSSITPAPRPTENSREKKVPSFSTRLSHALDIRPSTTQYPISTEVPYILTDQVIFRRFNQIINQFDLTKLRWNQEVSLGDITVQLSAKIMVIGFYLDGDIREYFISELVAKIHGLPLGRKLSYKPHTGEQFAKGELVPQQTVDLQGVDDSRGFSSRVKVGFTDWKKFGSDELIKSYSYHYNGLTVSQLLEDDPNPVPLEDQLKVMGILGLTKN